MSGIVEKVNSYGTRFIWTEYNLTMAATAIQKINGRGRDRLQIIDEIIKHTTTIIKNYDPDVRFVGTGGWYTILLPEALGEQNTYRCEMMIMPYAVVHSE